MNFTSIPNNESAKGYGSYLTNFDNVQADSNKTTRYNYDPEHSMGIITALDIDWCGAEIPNVMLDKDGDGKIQEPLTIETTEQLLSLINDQIGEVTQLKNKLNADSVVMSKLRANSLESTYGTFGGWSISSSGIYSDNGKSGEEYEEHIRLLKNEGGYKIEVKHNGTDVDSYGTEITAGGLETSNIDKTGLAHTSNLINNDGSGFLANSSIGWDANGDTTVEANVTISGTLHANNIESTNNPTVTSDERKKTIVNPVEASIEDIAKARIVDYKLKDSKNDKVSLGSIAQDWQNIYPNAITTDKDGFLGMDYSSIALASSVEAAKEIVKLKAENAELKERLAAIEAKLGI